MTKPYVVFCGLLIVCLGVACSTDNKTDHSSELDIASTKMASVSDNTKILYDIYCKNCHSISGTDAPESFNVDDWRSRLAQGKRQLLERAIAGTGNMPAQGMCMECSEQDLQELINYMSSSL